MQIFTSFSGSRVLHVQKLVVRVKAIRVCGSRGFMILMVFTSFLVTVQLQNNEHYEKV
jgi:hypothetical protein